MEKGLVDVIAVRHFLSGRSIGYGRYMATKGRRLSISGLGIIPISRLHGQVLLFGG